MRNVPSLPWWGWALIAFFFLNVLLDMEVGVFVPLVIGMVAAGVLGQRRGVGGGRADQPQPQRQPLPPVRPTDVPGPGWAGGTGAPPPPSPADAPAPGPSPWVRGPGHQPSAGTTSGTGAPGQGTDPDAGAQMPRIEVPQYPHGSPPPPAYPSAGASPSTDPVVSLGQLHLSRCARDLHTAATAGSTQDVSRVLQEVGEQTERLVSQLGGAGALPGSGRREFEAGLRRLQRDVAAARAEDPPGAKVARVARAAGVMGQTGRYE